jgi:hypothetical protein
MVLTAKRYGFIALEMYPSNLNITSDLWWHRLFSIIALMRTAHIRFVDRGVRRLAHGFLQTSCIPDSSKKSEGHLESTCRLITQEQMDTHIFANGRQK